MAGKKSRKRTRKAGVGKKTEAGRKRGEKAKLKEGKSRKDKGAKAGEKGEKKEEGMKVEVLGKGMVPRGKTLKRADKKLMEWRKSLMAPAERAMIEFFLYPVAKNRGEKRAAKRVMVESYLKGDEVVKQFILFLAHEQLSRAAGLRMMHNFAHFRKLMPKDTDAGEVRKAVYRSMFNYTTSLEGLTELVEFLGELGDEGAAKLLSYHLSYYSSMDNPGLQVMRNAVAEALSECSCTYALDALLSYAKYSERPTRVAHALTKWEKKLGKAGLSAEEKKEYAKEIAKVMGRKERHEYYR